MSVNNQLEQGTYLWVLHVDKIPPHIGVSVNGRYFSLKYNGKDSNISCRSVLKLLENKKIPTWIVALELPLELAEVQAVFDRYTCAKHAQATCLSPIIELIYNQSFDLILPELLTRLSLEAKLGRQILLHLNSDFTGKFEYTRSDVQQRLTWLHDAKRNEHLFKSH